MKFQLSTIDGGGRVVALMKVSRCKLKQWERIKKKKREDVLKTRLLNVTANRRFYCTEEKQAIWQQWQTESALGVCVD